MLLCLALGRVPAPGYAWLDHSRPAAGEVVQTGPPEVLLWFNEGIDIAFSYVQVLNSAGSGSITTISMSTAGRTSPA